MNARETVETDRGAETGFTLVELIITTAIVGILSSLSWGAFNLYKDDAEYSRAEAAYRHARTALEVGVQEAPADFAMGFQYSSADGDPLADPISSLLPGATTPEGVRLGVMFNGCGAGGPMTVNQFLVSQPCNSTKHLRWTRFCSGLEVMQSEVGQAKGCPAI